MRHLLTLALIAAAVAGYALGIGPFFFGAPLLGAVLLLVGLSLEAAFWLRLVRGRRAAS